MVILTKIAHGIGIFFLYSLMLSVWIFGLAALSWGLRISKPAYLVQHGFVIVFGILTCLLPALIGFFVHKFQIPVSVPTKYFMYFMILISVLAFSLTPWCRYALGYMRGIPAGYAIKGKTVYYDLKKIEGADAQTFQVLFSVKREKDSRSFDFAKDGSHIFFDGKRYDEVLVDSFEHIDGLYFRDANAVYYCRTDPAFQLSYLSKVDGAIPNMFEVQGEYGYDGVRYYHTDRKLERYHHGGELEGKRDDTYIPSEWITSTSTKKSDSKN